MYVFSQTRESTEPEWNNDTKKTKKNIFVLIANSLEWDIDSKHPNLNLNMDGWNILYGLTMEMRVQFRRNHPKTHLYHIGFMEFNTNCRIWP